MSQYLVLIYQDERQLSEPAAGSTTMRSHQDFQQANQSALRGGNALEHSHSATSIRPDGAGGFTVGTSVVGSVSRAAMRSPQILGRSSGFFTSKTRTWTKSVATAAAVDGN